MQHSKQTEGYIGYLIGHIFSVLIWLVERVGFYIQEGISFFKFKER